MEDAAKAAKKRLDDERKAREDSNLAEQAKMDAARPTPTQEENDLARLGHPVDVKAPDGSEDAAPQNRAIEADKSGTYKTKSA